jgi:hypothetical protein
MAATRRNRKAERIFLKLFSGVTRFNAANGKYSAIAWCLRRVQWLFAPRTWQVYTYVAMRSGPEAVSWQTDKQIAVDLGVTFRKIAPHLRTLQELGFLVMKEHDGERYVCLLDPYAALNDLVMSGKIRGERLDALNEDLEVMGLPSLPNVEQPMSSDAAAEISEPVEVKAPPLRLRRPLRFPPSNLGGGSAP